MEFRRGLFRSGEWFIASQYGPCGYLWGRCWEPSGECRLMHFEGISGRQIRSANLKHSNRASSYRNYTCPLLAIFSPLTQNCLGSEPPRGCRLRDKPRYMGALRQHTAGNRCYRSEEQTSELQSLMRTSYAVFCSKQKQNYKSRNVHTPTTNC